MCGIAGVWTPGARGTEVIEAARSMAAVLGHRGPDEEGCWLDAPAGLAFGHRRLCVLDPSPSGAQPMHTPDGRFVLSFNGEIYNHTELRKDLDHPWRGTADTETLLIALATWGTADALARLNGMFAFALWDAREQALTLARDPVGEKPLYIAQGPPGLAFASELPALRCLPWIDDGIDRSALADYFSLGYVPAPGSILRGVTKLEAGTVVQYRPDRPGGAPRGRSRRFWSTPQVAEDGIDQREATPTTVDDLHGALRRSVGLRMAADVPLGAFLSGGLDSSLVVALMQEIAPTPVRTFTVAMEESSHDEADHAAAVAAHLGTQHTTIPMAADAGLELAPGIAAMYGEPYADPSAVPTALLARLARPHVTVALSGDGGDEVFGGYNRYTLGQAVWQRLARVPQLARHPAAAALQALSPDAWDALISAVGRGTPFTPPRLAGDKLHKLAAVLPARTGDDLYLRLARTWQVPPLRDVVDATNIPAGTPPTVTGLIDRMMLMDALRTLPDQMLVKVDRASMAASLEVRVPLLDPDVITATWRLPMAAKVHGGDGKVALRQILDTYVPRQLWDRPKMGFDPPIGRWLRGPLRPWAEDLLAVSALRRDGALDVPRIRRTWAEHRLGRRNHDYRLWAVLMYLSWRQG